MGEPSNDELGFMADLYTRQDGNLQTLARLTGCSLSIMQKNQPEDAMDFAKRVLNGTYTADKSEQAKKEMRDKLSWEVNVQKSKLKRTPTIEMTGNATEADLDFFGKIFTEQRGNLDKLAKMFKANVALM